MMNSLSSFETCSTVTFWLVFNLQKLFRRVKKALDRRPITLNMFWCFTEDSRWFYRSHVVILCI